MPSIKLVSELSEKFQGLGRQLMFEIYIELFIVTFYVAAEWYPGCHEGKISLGNGRVAFQIALTRLLPEYEGM